MSKRINIILSDSVWELLQLLPKGERSAYAEEAIKAAFALQDRRAAVAEMEVLRQTTPPVDGCSENWIREDRDSHN